MGTDPDLTNPPGLPAIAYRSGTQAGVLRRMRAALATRLPKLAVAGTDDPGIALLDAWATIADVVTFYQERIANEGYLGTATERRSVLELARSIGYELRPGVSAAVLLDLRTQATAAPASGPLAAPSRVVVAKGTQVLSAPGPGELPQTFETDEEITLDATCDEIPLVRTTRPQVQKDMTALYLASVATGLRAGDAILVVERPTGVETMPVTGVPSPHEFRVLRTVEPVPSSGSSVDPSTRVTWDKALKHDYDCPEVYAFGVRAGVFGANAPDWKTLPDEVRVRYLPGNPRPLNSTTAAELVQILEWPGFALDDAQRVIDLDTPQSELGRGSFLVLDDPEATEHDNAEDDEEDPPPLGPVVYRVETAEPSAVEAFAVGYRTTRVTLEGSDESLALLERFDRRRTTVHTLTRRLDLARVPIGGTVPGPDLALDRAAPLVPGRPVLVTGSHDGVPVLEQVTITSVTPDGDVTKVVLDRAFEKALDRDSVRVHANVVPTTHGETVPDEVLGSGDGSVPNQRFTLNKPNVTHVPDSLAPGGVADSLTIRVDGIEWKEIPSLYPAGPQDRVYVVRIDDDAVATVIFGDGGHGARLPTGQENVVARYRSGIGPAGEVGAHTLIVLPQRPPGVASVDNPFAAGGASPPETLAEARANASLAVVTLDRVVALRDYQDFARAYGGISKAHASVVRGRTSTFVVVTVAGTAGKEVPQLTLDTLRDALDARRDRAAEVLVLSYDPKTRFRVAVEVLAAPERDREVVKAAVKEALRSAFAVDRRDFGQAVTVAEVTSLVQGVPGVLACRVTELRHDVEPPPTTLVDDLLARDAWFEPGKTDADPTKSTSDRVVPAELLLVNPDAVHTGDMAP